ncbi:MAG: hypothetical protein ACRCU2_02405 [Planktothrix sp.]
MNKREKASTGITLMVEGVGGFIFVAEGLGPIPAIVVTLILCVTTLFLSIINQKTPLALLFSKIAGFLPGRS